jgi:hypothetical protein
LGSDGEVEQPVVRRIALKTAKVMFVLRTRFLRIFILTTYLTWGSGT